MQSKLMTILLYLSEKDSQKKSHVYRVYINWECAVFIWGRALNFMLPIEAEGLPVSWDVHWGF